MIHATPRARGGIVITSQERKGKPMNETWMWAAWLVVLTVIFWFGSKRKMQACRECGVQTDRALCKEHDGGW
jgi:hypothetical protein